MACTYLTGSCTWPAATNRRDEMECLSPPILRKIYVQIYVCVYVCVYLCIHVYVCMYIFCNNCVHLNVCVCGNNLSLNYSRFFNLNQNLKLAASWIIQNIIAYNTVVSHHFEINCKIVLQNLWARELRTCETSFYEFLLWTIFWFDVFFRHKKIFKLLIFFKQLIYSYIFQKI